MESKANERGWGWYSRSVLPDNLGEAMSRPLPGHTRRPHMEFEVQKRLLERPDTAEILRRASTR